MRLLIMIFAAFIIIFHLFDGGCCCCDNKSRSEIEQVVGSPSQKYEIITRRKSMRNVCCIYYQLGATFNRIW